MKNEIYTKKGYLTAYAMACGYRHWQASGNVQLSHNGGDSFELYISKDLFSAFGEIRNAFDHMPEYNGMSENGASVWHYFTALPAARIAMRMVLNHYNIKTVRKKILLNDENINIIY